jgi:ribonuclease HI
MAKPKKKWYVVWRGIKTGIFETWDECKAQVHGVEGAQYKSFESLKEAKSEFERGKPNYTGTPGAKTKVMQPKLINAPIIWDSISVDAACSGNPGLMEYQGVHTKTKELLFHQGPYKHATNNVGEFLALVHGLAYLQKIGRNDVPIYSDSRTAQAWVRNRKMKSELERIPKNQEVWVLIDRAVLWMETHKWTNPILKWETETWGEIPADFGRK